MKETPYIPAETKSLWSGLGFAVALFFLVVTAAIAGTWFSVATDYVNKHLHAFNALHLLYAAFIVLLVGGIALISLLACVALTFGKKYIYRGTAASALGAESDVKPIEVNITSMFGLELMREFIGKLEDITPQPFPPVPVDVPWSDIAFDHYNTPGSSNARTDIFEATIWHLIAKGCVTLSLRYEAQTYIYLCKRKKQLKSYCTYQKNLPEGSAHWEKNSLPAFRQSHSFLF